MSERQIDVGRDFTRFPAGRYHSDGKYSGQRFREEFLAPALTQNSKVIVHLDGTMGYGSSFLEEAFGGLVREAGFSPQQLKSSLTLLSKDKSLVDEILSYIDQSDN